MSSRRVNKKRNRQATGAEDDLQTQCSKCGQLVPSQSYRHHYSQCGIRAASSSYGVFTTAKKSDVPLRSALNGAPRPDVAARAKEFQDLNILEGLELDNASVMPHQQHPVLFNIDSLGRVTREDGKDHPMLVIPQDIQTHVYSQEWNDEDDTSELGEQEEEGTATKPDTVPSPAVDNSHEDEIFGDVGSTYGLVQGAEKIKAKPNWSWDRPPGVVLSPKLTSLLASREGRFLGNCFEYPVEVARKNRSATRLADEEVSLLRMMHFCDQRSANSRGFLDDFLDLLAQESRSERKFNINVLSKMRRLPGTKSEGQHHREQEVRSLRRQTLSKKVIDQYGKGCEPRVVNITVSTEDLNVVAVEESNPDLTGPSVPNEIENRERLVISCIVFDVEAQIKDLLDDETIFGNLDNLVVNPDNPFAPYENRTGCVDEALDGTWHAETLKRLRTMKTDPLVDGVDFILYLILYVDKTGTAGNQRYPLEPVIFTFAIIRRGLRYNPHSWRIIGYIPDLDAKSAAEKRLMGTKNRGASAQSYHLCLEEMLKGLEAIAEKGGFPHWVRLGKYKKKMRIRPEVMFIISDGKAADMNSSRTPSTHPGRRISRACTTLQKEADDVLKECQPVVLDDTLENLFLTAGKSVKAVQEDPLHQIGEMPNLRQPTAKEARGIVDEAKQELNKRSFVPARNAFVARCVRFGLDKRSIWGACPIDLMHAFQSGIVKYMVKMVIDKLSTASQTALDRLVHKLFHDLRCKEKSEYPRLSFSKGFSKLTMITSDEWVGKLFVILLVLKTEEGRSIFKSTFAAKDIPLPDSFAEIGRGGKKGKRGKSFVTSMNDILDQVKDLNSAADKVDKNRAGASEEDKLARMGVPANDMEEAKRMKKRSKPNEEEPEEMLRPCSANDFTQIAEALLCFHAWYKEGIVKTTRDGKADRGMIQASVQRLLAMVRLYTPRKKGCGWKIQKFHDILHLALDIERFGSPSNYDAGPQESGLKSWAKLPAQTSQKRGYEIFLRQVAARVYEQQCITRALRAHGIRGSVEKALETASTRIQGSKGSVDRREGKEDTKKPCLGGTAYIVYGKDRDKNTQKTTRVAFRASERLTKDKRTMSAFVVSPVIENFLRWAPNADSVVPARRDPKGGDPYWDLKTECSMVPSDSDTRLTLRCHPNFQNEGPWYDWVIVRFDCDRFFHKDVPGNRRSYEALRRSQKDRLLEAQYDPMKHTPQWNDDCVPCKILAFGQQEDGTPMALVHGCSFRTTNSDIEEDTVLVEFWRLEYHNLAAEYNEATTIQVPDPTEEVIDSDNEDGEEDKNGAGTKVTGIRRYEAPYLCWVPTTSIVCRCFVVEEEPGIHEVLPYTKPRRKAKPRPSNRVMVIRPHELWAQEFT